MILTSILSHLMRKKEGLKKGIAYKLSGEKNSGIVCYSGEINLDGEEYCLFATRSGEDCIKVKEIPKKNISLEGKRIRVTILPDTRTYTHWYREEGGFEIEGLIYQRLNRALNRAR